MGRKPLASLIVTTVVGFACLLSIAGCQSTDCKSKTLYQGRDDYPNHFLFLPSIGEIHFDRNEAGEVAGADLQLFSDFSQEMEGPWRVRIYGDNGCSLWFDVGAVTDRHLLICRMDYGIGDYSALADGDVVGVEIFFEFGKSVREQRIVVIE